VYPVAPPPVTARQSGPGEAEELEEDRRPPSEEEELEGAGQHRTA
jgi:hypothetical protein